MTDIETLIVRALAHADALRLPVRNWSGNASANRHLGLELLHTHGVPIRIGGDAATRKSGERLLAEADEAGLAIVTRYGKVRFPFVRLTDRGEATARALAGLPGRAVGRLVLAKIAELTDRRPKTMERLWLDEVALNGGRGWGDATDEDRRQLGLIELDVLPATSAGWVAANSTCHGHVRYKVTAEGWKELDRPSTPPSVGKVPASDPDAEDLYRTEQDIQLQELQVATPRKTGEIGSLPMIVAHAGVPV